MQEHELREQAPEVARALHGLVPYADASKREENAAILMRVQQAERPSLDDPDVSSVAFLCHIYLRLLPAAELDEERLAGLWNAAVWSINLRLLRDTTKTSQNLSAALLLIPRLFGTAVEDRMLEDLASIGPRLRPAHQARLLQALESRSGAVVEALRTEMAATADATAGPPRGPADVPAAGIAAVARELPSDHSLRQVCEAVERLLPLGSRRHRDANRDALAACVRDGLTTAEARTELARLATFAASSITFHALQGRDLTDEQLALGHLVADYAAGDPSQRERLGTRVDAYLIDSLRQLRDRSLLPDAYFLNAPGGRPEWSRALTLVTAFFEGSRRENRLSPAAAESWIATVASHVDRFEPADLRQFVEEIVRHDVGHSLALEQLREALHDPEPDDTANGPLRFLPRSERDAFEAAVRDAKLERLREALVAHREDLLSMVSQTLADESFETLLPPKGRVPMRGFADASRGALSDEVGQNRKALNAFTEATATLRDRSSKAVAEEWRLFAAQKVEGRPAVISAWTENFRSNSASLQQVWNLAVTYNDLGEPALALSFLEPTVRAEKATLEHLRFALYTAISVLRRSNAREDDRNAAASFLLAHLRSYPDAGCSLLWLHLDNESDEQRPANERIAALGVFTDFRSRPVVPPRLSEPRPKLSPSGPGRQTTVAEVEQFRDQLVLHNMRPTWRLWLNGFLEDEPRNDFEWEWLWQVHEWLARALEEDRDFDGARRVVERAAERHNGWYRYLERSKRPTQHAVRLHRRIAEFLLNLVKRISQLERRRAIFDNFIAPVPELKRRDDPKNERLHRLIADLLEPEAVPADASDEDRRGARGTVADVDVWTQLNAELRETADLASLAAVAPRVVAQLDTWTPGRAPAIRDDVQSVVHLLTELPRWESELIEEGALVARVDGVSRELERLERESSGQPQLSLLVPVVAALQRALVAFAGQLSLRPALDIGTVAGSAGLPTDAGTSSLAVRIDHTAPVGAVANIALELEAADGVVQRGEASIRMLDSGVSSVVGIPVRLEDAGAGVLHARVEATYDWGVVRGLRASSSFEVQRFSFAELLADRAIDGYEVPSPVTQEALDPDRDDQRLFQGREREMALIEDTLCAGRWSASPHYFHGIRKVGKTSLLRRIAKTLAAAGLAPVTIDLYTADAHSRPIDVVAKAIVRKVGTAMARQWPDVPFSYEPESYHDPFVLSDLLEAIRDAFGDRQPVLLIDEFQFLVTDRATPLLDSLKAAYESRNIGLVLSGLQGPEAIAATRAQLTLGATRIDFLDEVSLARAIREPLHDFGLIVPESVTRGVYAETGGHPFFMSCMADELVKRMNADHRDIAVEQDVDTAAASVAATQHAFFQTTWLSRHHVTEEEESAAIKFAHELPAGEDGLVLDEATRVVEANLLNSLNTKHILSVRDRRGEKRLEFKGRLLVRTLRARIAEDVVRPPRPPEYYFKVGVFVDIENCIGLIPALMEFREFASTLLEFAGRFGHVETREVCAAPWNLKDKAYGVQLGFEKAGFNVSWVQDELRHGVQKELADGLLIERMVDAETDTVPDVYVIVTGDKDYYQRIMTLLGNGYSVHVVGADEGSVATAYKNLVMERRRRADALGRTESDFFLHDLRRDVLGETSVVEGNGHLARGTV